MNRKRALNVMHYLAYRDGRFDARTYAENRISYKAANERVTAGLALRRAHIESGEFPKIAHEGDRIKALESLNDEG